MTAAGLGKRQARADAGPMAALGDEVFDADLLILGGGMIGLTLAKAVSGVGMTVALIERAEVGAFTRPAFDGRVSAIAYGLRCTLEGIGV